MPESTPHSATPASSPCAASAVCPGLGAAKDRDWPDYFDAIAGLPPRDTLLHALSLFDAEPRAGAAPRLALDLGCGAGRDALELLRRGWRVVAVDGSVEGVARMLRDAPPEARPRLTAVVAPLERLDLAAFAPTGADLVNASFSLPFVPPASFGAVWASIVRALAPGGRFAGQLFGDRDEWRVIPGRSHHTREEAEALLGVFDAERFEEVEKDGKDAFGDPKHHHVFHVVARRRGA